MDASKFQFVLFFSDVIMIVPGDLRAEISNLLNGPSFAQFNMHIEVEALNNPTESAGTADALRQIESKIKVWYKNMFIFYDDV